MIGHEHPRYTISVAAELAGLHPQTLRIYEAKGLVRPRRTTGGSRRYSDADLERLRRITQLTGEMGMNLAGASTVMSLEDTVTELSRHVLVLERQLAVAATRLQHEVAEAHRSHRRDLVIYDPPKHPEKRWISRS